MAHLCASIGAPGCDMHACDTANAEHLQYLAEVLLSRQVGYRIPRPSQPGGVCLHLSYWEQWHHDQLSWQRSNSE